MHCRMPFVRLLTFVVFGSLTTLACALAACGDDSSPPPFDSPYAEIPAAATITAPGLSAPVEIVRDEYGIPHIYAQTIEDAAFGNGYVMASDRLAQMQLFRYNANGRVAELFGALEQDQIDDDIRMRMHRMQPLAQETWDQLNASADAGDQEIVRYLTRYSDGVNQYADELRAGRHTLDEAVGLFFDPARFEAWTPVDSLTLGRLQTYALSYHDSDIRISNLYQRARQVFDPASPDPALARRAGMGYDTIQPRPLDPTATIDGFPNVGTDTGTRAKPAARAAGAAGGADSATRPWVPLELLAQAAYAARPPAIPGLLDPDKANGSNNWIVGPALAGGATLLANDPHLPLKNPSIWYLLHITVPGVLDAEGASFPGLPGLQLGHNEHLAWGATVVFHDTQDFYLEDIAPCAAGGGDCVMFDGQEVALETHDETIKFGALGTIVGQVDVTYETVPHHGPILPTIVDHTIVPRTGNQAIAVRYTGHEVTFEVRATYQLMRAATVAEGFSALESWAHGAMNWVLVDDQGGYAWTSTAHVPLRSPACYSFNASSNPDGIAPFLVLPSDGSCEWEGWLDARYIPHAINPAKGYIATANADPVGETADGDALNGPLVDGRPLYLSALYDPGYRVGRITRRLEALKAAGPAMTMDDMASIQADAYSNFGAVMVPHIAAADASQAADVVAWKDGLSAAKQARLAAALARLGAWTFDTPADGTTATETGDSIATAIFNLWATHFHHAVLDDELALVGESVESNMMPRLTLTMFEHPELLHSEIAVETGESILCDDIDTPAFESCQLLVLVALDEALDWLETQQGADMATWRWGKLHTLTLKALTPSPELSVPLADDPNPDWRAGYPRHGDEFSVDSSDNGYDDWDFSYAHGPSMRHITQFTPGTPPVTMMSLPGGATYDRASPHYRDLMDGYWLENEYFIFPWLTADIIARAESRWRLEPPR